MNQYFWYCLFLKPLMTIAIYLDYRYARPKIVTRASLIGHIVLEIDSSFYGNQNLPQKKLFNQLLKPCNFY